MDGDADTRQLQTRVEALERDLSFLARHVQLVGAGHATVIEYGRYKEIVERFPRGLPRPINDEDGAGELLTPAEVAQVSAPIRFDDDEEG